MQNTSAKEKACILWIPTSTHKKPKQRHIVGKFRISDYQLSKDHNFELWGEVKPENLEDNDNISIDIYKSTDRIAIFILHILGAVHILQQFLSDKILIEKGKYKMLIPISWGIKHIQSLLIFLLERCHAPNNMETVHHITLKCEKYSDNGLMLVSYEYLPLPDVSFDIFRKDGKLPECIYHHLKLLYHEHRFHDKEQDANMTPFYVSEEQYTNRQNNHGILFELAIEHYLGCFEKLFKSNEVSYSKYWDQLNSSRSSAYLKHKKYSIIANILVPIILLVLAFIYWDNIQNFTFCLNGNSLAIRDLIDISKKGCVILAFMSIFILLMITFLCRWRYVADKYILKNLLYIEGQYEYAKSLLKSHYNKDDNDHCRKKTFNITNNYSLSVAYLESSKKKVDIHLALISIMLSIFFAICGVLLGFIK